MVELSSFSARTFKSLEVPTLPLSSAPAASSRKRHSYGGSTRHPSQASVPHRRCVSWSPGGERVKVQLVLRPPTLSQAARLDFHSSRTFGGIHRKVRLNLPTAEERQDFASWTESFSKSTRRQRYVVAFVNSRSGGQTGSLIMKTLQASLSPDAGQQEKMRGEVCDLSREGEPEATIRGLAERLTNEPRETLDMRLLVCGGDGTVTWILTALDNCRELEDDLDRVPVGIVPLGTGNDLARSLGWGPKLSKVSDILEYLKLIAEAEPVDLDQWRIVLRPHAELPADHKLRTCGSHPQPVRDETLAAQLRRDMRKALNSVAPDNGAEEAESSESKELFLGFWQNYFSIGVDAKVTFHVDLQRSHTDCGRRCFSWGCGKLCYAWQAVLHALGAPALLQQIPSLKVAPPDYDADALQDLSMGPEAFRQLMFVNINSYAAGQQVQPQPDDALRPPAPGDGLIEVLTVSSVTEGIAMFTGCGRPRYVTTGEELAFSVSGGQCMQLDGEPWRLDVGCDVLIEPHQRVHMLLAPGSGRYWRGHITPEFWATSSQEPRPRCSTIAERDEDFDECSPFR